MPDRVLNASELILARVTTSPASKSTMHLSCAMSKKQGLYKTPGQRSLARRTARFDRMTTLAISSLKNRIAAHDA